MNKKKISLLFFGTTLLIATPIIFTSACGSSTDAVPTQNNQDLLQGKSTWHDLIEKEMYSSAPVVANNINGHNYSATFQLNEFRNFRSTLLNGSGSTIQESSFLAMAILLVNHSLEMSSVKTTLADAGKKTEAADIYKAFYDMTRAGESKHLSNSSSDSSVSFNRMFSKLGV